MKKLLLFSAGMAMAVSGMAQRDKLSTARTAYSENELQNARKVIDEVIAHPETKESAEAWLMRANIYGKIVETPALASQVPNAIYESSNSLLRTVQLNSRYDKEGVDAAIERAMAYLMNKGLGFYQEKQYDSAIAVFTGVRTFLTAVGGANRFSDDPDRRTKLARIARNSRQFLAYSAYEKKDFALAQSTLEDLRKIVKDLDAKNGQDIYTYLLKTYQATGNQEKFAEIVKEAAAKYPDNATFQDLQINQAIKSGETASILSMLESNPRLSKSAELQATLASTYFRVGAAENKSQSADTLAMAEQHYQKAEAAYRSAIALKDEAAYNFGLGLIYYNRANNLLVKITSLGTSAADNQKYEEYNKQSKDLMREAATYFEKTVSLYDAAGLAKLDLSERASDRKAYRNSLEALREMYGRLDDNAKRLEADAKIKALPRYMQQ